jgi:threonine dehydrogenase-like Zn-dependent dehydrogenase
MKAAIFQGKGAIELGERPDPTIKEPTDAVVRVVLACVCGSDLWYYRGESDYPVGSPIGHEFLGVTASRSLFQLSSIGMLGCMVARHRREPTSLSFLMMC